MADKFIIKIRKGLSGYPYSICKEDGHFISNANSIAEIEEFWAEDIKKKRVKFIKELDLFPYGIDPGYKVYGYIGQASASSAVDQVALLEKAGASEIKKEVSAGYEVLEKLISKLNGGDTLVVTDLGQLASTLYKVNEIINSLLQRRVKVHVLDIGLIDNTVESKKIVDTLKACAAYERNKFVERTQAGKANAREHGKRVDGRPPKYTQKEMNQAIEMLEDFSYKEVSSRTGISVSTLTREKKKRSVL